VTLCAGGTLTIDAARYSTAGWPDNFTAAGRCLCRERPCQLDCRSRLKPPRCDRDKSATRMPREVAMFASPQTELVAVSASHIPLAPYACT
jgi:hypothetical protein